MQRFKNILVVCDENSNADWAVDCARDLAIKNGGRLTLIDVVDFEKADISDILVGLNMDTALQLQNEIFQHHHLRLKAMADELQEEGLQVTASVVNGLPFVEVVKAVILQQHDLVIKASDWHASASLTVAPGLDSHLIRKCPCPVWIINQPLPKRGARIMAAIDPAETGMANSRTLNQEIMNCAVSATARHQGELRVFHAWSLQEESALLESQLIKTSPGEYASISTRKRTLRAKQLRQIVSAQTDRSTSCKVHLHRGNASEAVPAFAQANRIDLLVMGSVTRTDVTGFFIGNTAEGIFNRITCSVLALKPKGFRSPLVEATSVPGGAAKHRPVRSAVKVGS